jgi:hypothetical protein
VRYLIPFFFICIWFSTATGQGTVQYKIADTGCKVYLYCDSVEFTPIEYEDNKGYLSDECLNEGEGSGVVYMKLWKPLGLLDDPYELLTSFMENVKSNFDIVSGSGPQKTYVEQTGSKHVYAIRDKWKDQEGDEFQVKGWTDGNHTAVMFYYHPPADNPFDFMEEDAEIERFLDGFRFPIQ